MKYRKLGKTGLLVSEIGFGAWGIGGESRGATSYGTTEDRQSRRALRAAYELGVTFFDTSDLYGYGHSEQLIGEELCDVRDKIVIASKVGFLEHGGPQDFSPQYIRKSIEGSLKRLKSDYLDLYQLHCPDIKELEKDDATLAVLQELVKAGKVRAIGVSVRFPEDAATAIQLGFQSIQVNFSLIDQRAVGSGLFNICESKGVGFVARTPLCFGFLTGRYSANEVFGEKDHRSACLPEQRKVWAESINKFIGAIQDDHQQTNTQVALRYCISYPHVSVTIPGMLCEEHVRENVAASDLGPLSGSEIVEIESIYKNNTFFVSHPRYAKN